MTKREENQKMKVKSLLAAILGLALALSALTGVAGAGKPDDPGKSGDAPGQVKKADEAPPATPASQGKSALAPGQTKTGKAATPTKGKSAEAKAKHEAGPASVKSQGEGQLRTAHKKVLICHSTGSTTNPFVVISVSVNALKSGHDQLGTREAVLSEMATQPGRRTADVHGGRTDIILGPSSPGRIENKAELEAQCGQLAGIQKPPEQPQVLAAVEQQPPAAEQEQGGVLGAQAVVRQPPAQQGQGGVLGEIGAVTSAELPFTGIQLWIALLAGIGLLAAGLGARRAMR